MLPLLQDETGIISWSCHKNDLYGSISNTKPVVFWRDKWYDQPERQSPKLRSASISIASPIDIIVIRSFRVYMFGSSPIPVCTAAEAKRIDIDQGEELRRPSSQLSTTLFTGSDPAPFPTHPRTKTMNSPTSESNILLRSPSPTQSDSELPLVISSTGKHFHGNCVLFLSSRGMLKLD